MAEIQSQARQAEKKVQKLIQYKNYDEKAARRAVQNKTKAGERDLKEVERVETRAAAHPDFKPGISFPQMQALSDANDLRSILLRGSNLLTSGDNPILNLATGIASAPGRAVANVTTDAQNRYLNPILEGNVLEGVTNFGLDLFDIFPSVGAQAVSTVGKGAKSAAQQTGRYLTQGAVKNAYKFNPSTFKPIKIESNALLDADIARANQDATIFSQSPANRAKLEAFRPRQVGAVKLPDFSVTNQQARFIDDPEAIRLHELFKKTEGLDPNLSIKQTLGGIPGRYFSRNHGDLNDFALVNRLKANTSNVPSTSAYTDALHETTHSRSIRLGATDAEKEIAGKAWSPMLELEKNKARFSMPEEEAFAVQNELRINKLKDIDGSRVYTEKDIPEIEKGLQDMIKEGHDYLFGVNVKDFNMPALIKSLNQIGLGATTLGLGMKTAGAIEQKKKGGIVKDNMGYWNPDNWGKIVEIDSPNITMKGVNQDLIGVSDEGDIQYMEREKPGKPGKDYKFKGKKVKEYPVGKYGVNQQDEKTVQHLDQLLNFTNKPKAKNGWLDKYK
jgi:hypothetical protein